MNTTVKLDILWGGRGIRMNKIIDSLTDEQRMTLYGYLMSIVTGDMREDITNRFLLMMKELEDGTTREALSMLVGYVSKYRDDLLAKLEKRVDDAILYGGVGQ